MEANAPNRERTLRAALNYFRGPKWVSRLVRVGRVSRRASVRATQTKNTSRGRRSGGALAHV